jgi:hypothetical protein
VAEMVTSSFNKTLQLLNEKLPRPALHGVTPEDVVSGTAEEKKKLNAEYLIKEQLKEKVRAWSKSKDDLAKDVLMQKNLSNKELLIKHYFFQRNPLRRISNLPIEVWTNLF